jgi:hypothetical protein
MTNYTNFVKFLVNFVFTLQPEEIATEMVDRWQLDRGKPSLLPCRMAGKRAWS